MNSLEGLKTLAGLGYVELVKKLDEELPPDAYSAVPGGADLTDIDPNHMRRILNACFGLCGVGWGYTYRAEDLEFAPSSEKKEGWVCASLKRLELWYLLVDEAGQALRNALYASGGSDNKNNSYALKGAITNAIGNAVSNIGFQESVYLGLRSHRTVKTGARPAAATAAPKPTATAPLKATTAAPTASQPAAANPMAAFQTMAPQPAVVEKALELAGVVINLEGNRHHNKRLSDLSPEALGWFAEKFRPQDDYGVRLQEMARQYQASLK
jgi:hypothetical protein